MASHIRQFVVGSESDVPSEFVRMSEYMNAQNESPRRGEIYQAIAKAWEKKKISGCKVMLTPHHSSGPIFVDVKQAQSLIEALKDEGAKNEHARNANTSERAIAIDCTQCSNLDGTAEITDSLKEVLIELRSIREMLASIGATGAGSEWNAG